MKNKGLTIIEFLFVLLIFGILLLGIFTILKPNNYQKEVVEPELNKMFNNINNLKKQVSQIYDEKGKLPKLEEVKSSIVINDNFYNIVYDDNLGSIEGLFQGAKNEDYRSHSVKYNSFKNDKNKNDHRLYWKCETNIFPNNAKSGWYYPVFWDSIPDECKRN